MPATASRLVELAAPTRSGPSPQTHPAARLGLVGESRCVAPDPFEDLSDVLRILTAEVLEGKRIVCIEVAAELDPVFRSQRAIDLEGLARPALM